MSDYPDGEGPTTKDAAKRRVDAWPDEPTTEPEPREDALDDPEHNEPDA